jgi:hypothetical protein
MVSRKLVAIQQSRVRPQSNERQLRGKRANPRSALFVSLIERARQSTRLRTNHNFHFSMEDNPHRFLNVMVQGTYIIPHRHRDPSKSESLHHLGV